MQFLKSAGPEERPHLPLAQPGVPEEPPLVLEAVVEQHRIRLGYRVVAQPAMLERQRAFGVAEPLPLALRQRGAPALGHHMDVALGHVERRGTGFNGVAPVRRLSLNVFHVGRGRKQRRILAVFFWKKNIDRQFHAVAHGDVHVLDEPHARQRWRGLDEFGRIHGFDGRFAFRGHGKKLRNGGKVDPGLRNC